VYVIIIKYWLLVIDGDHDDVTPAALLSRRMPLSFDARFVEPNGSRTRVAVKKLSFSLFNIYVCERASVCREQGCNKSNKNNKGN
jgi:hypothetical protein